MREHRPNSCDLRLHIASIFAIVLWRRLVNRFVSGCVMLLFIVWYNQLQEIAEKLCSEGCTTICDGNSWGTMAENDVFDKDVGRIGRSSLLNGFSFAKSSQIFGSDSNAAFVSG